LPPLPPVSTVLRPTHLKMHHFGSRFLPHSTTPIRCLLPLQADRLLLIGHDEGLSVLDMYPQDWNDSGGIDLKGPEDAAVRPIWEGESVFQMLELNHTSSVVLMLVSHSTLPHGCTAGQNPCWGDSAPAAPRRRELAAGRRGRKAIRLSRRSQRRSLPGLTLFGSRYASAVLGRDVRGDGVEGAQAGAGRPAERWTAGTRPGGGSGSSDVGADSVRQTASAK
jgi:hypothetical protein